MKRSSFRIFKHKDSSGIGFLAIIAYDAQEVRMFLGVRNKAQVGKGVMDLSWVW